MRRRVVRDMGTLLGVVVILAGVVALQDFFKRSGLTEVMDKQRVAEENKQKDKGQQITNWELLRKTKGTRSKGPTFAPEVLAMRDKQVSFVGFMTPLYEFRGVKEFILLPLPLQCYFCQTPPMREVVLVQMAADKTTNIVNEPVLFSGTLTLNEGPGTKFFYVLKDAISGSDMSKMSPKNIGKEHMMESEAQRKKNIGTDKEILLPGMEAPKPGAAPLLSAPAVPPGNSTPSAETPVVPAPPTTAPAAPPAAPPATPAPAEPPK